MILSVGDPAEEPEPTPRRALADLLHDVVPPTQARETEVCRGSAG